MHVFLLAVSAECQGPKCTSGLLWRGPGDQSRLYVKCTPAHLESGSLWVCETWPFLDLDLEIQPCVSVGRNQQQVASHGICSDMPNHLLCFKPPGTYSFMLYRCYCPLLQASSISSLSVHRSLVGARLNYVPFQSLVTAMSLSSEVAAFRHILEPLLYVSILGQLKAQLIYISMNRGL